MALGFKPGGLFGQAPITMQGILPGDQPDYLPPRPQMTPEAPKKGGIFAPGGVGRNIAGAIGDALLQMNRMEPIFAPQMQHRQTMAARQQQAERDRIARREDMQWEWQNKPASGDEYTYFEDNAGNRWRQHKGTGKVDQTPTFIDKTPKEFVHEGMRFSIPNPYLSGAGGAGNVPTVSDAAGYNAIPAGGQYRDPQGNLRTKGGGAAAPASRPFSEAPAGYAPPLKLKSGFMTSGRRTIEGNRAVGGVANSGHLRGTDADFDGPDLNAVMQEVRGLPGFEKVFIHKGHVHARGKWNVPYHGRNGTKGLKR